MHEYQKIKTIIVDLLSKAGYEEDKPDTNLDCYGSIHCIYAAGESRFMIQWDGEEGFGSVESWQGDNSWVMLEPIVPESIEQEFNINLEALCKVVKARL